MFLPWVDDHILFQGFPDVRMSVLLWEITYLVSGSTSGQPLNLYFQAPSGQPQNQVRAPPPPPPLLMKSWIHPWTYLMGLNLVPPVVTVYLSSILVLTRLGVSSGKGIAIEKIKMNNYNNTILKNLQLQLNSTIPYQTALDGHMYHIKLCWMVTCTISNCVGWSHVPYHWIVLSFIMTSMVKLFFFFQNLFIQPHGKTWQLSFITWKFSLQYCID